MQPVSKVELFLDVAENLRSLANSIQAVADAMAQSEAPTEAPPPAKEAAPPTEAVPKEKPVTWEQVREALGKKSLDGKTEAVRELLLKYGAPKLSGIDPKHYKALLADTEVL